MCGRFGLTRSPWVLARKLGADPTGCDFTPRYNIAPTQRLLAVINEAAPALTKLRWGLVPAWSDGHDAVKLSTFNARIETAATARTYRNAFHERRCAIFADGYFEWRKDPDGGKTPLWITRVDEESLVFAGLWERWRSRSSDETVESCTIVTQPPNSFVERMHSRMPVALDVDQGREWLRPGARDTSELLEILTPTPAEIWTAHPVGRRVGSVRFDEPNLIAPAELSLPTPTLF
jgi:putative SOS response-associated peptidase YedK